VAVLVGEIGRQESFDDLPCLLLSLHPAAQRANVRIGVEASQFRDLDGVRQCGANPLDLVRSDLLSVAGTTQHDAKRPRVGQHGLSTRDAVVGIVILRVIASRTMIDDLVSSFGQLANEGLLKLKGRMVGADMNM